MTTPATTRVQRLLHTLRRPRGTRTDDLMLRIVGVLAALGTAGALLHPTAAALTAFMLYTLWTNGPHSPVLPGGYEPVLLLYGAVYDPLLIGVLATVGTVFQEWINYHLYARARGTRTVQRLADGVTVRRLTRLFDRSPFAAIVFCAIGPVPFWMVRCLAVLSGYSIPRYLTATAVGRFPRLWAIAALGMTLGLPTWLVGAAIGFSLLFAAGLWVLHRRPRPARTTPAPAPTTA